MDGLTAGVETLAREQLRRLIAWSPRSFEDSDERGGRAARIGITALHAVGARVDGVQPLIERLMELMVRDDRYRFLDAIPYAPILSMARALALEDALYGMTTDAVAELSLQMGMFSVLLDGLIDEAPDDLSPARAWLVTAMDPDGWSAHRLPIPSLPHLPVTEAVCRLAASVIDTVIDQPGWHDPIVREQFALATRDAFRAELESVEIAISAGLDPRLVRDRILAKSTAPIWAGALLPVCAHGWPDGVDPHAFRETAESIGRFGGWIDDVVDVAEDLRADRWSAVLFEIHAHAQALGVTSGTDPRTAIVDALDSDLTVELIARSGVARADEVRRRLAGLGIPSDDIVAALCDAAADSLRIGSPEPAR